jgi:molybdopterin-guanine dinucleotide biosynthesis protein A
VNEVRAICGVFVGGASRRMGGAPKGLLRVPPRGLPGAAEPTTLVERTHAVLEEALGPGARVFLVGAHPSYAELGLPVLPDEPAGIGPLGGLVALLRAAHRAGPGTFALAVACDMPHLEAALVRRLAAFEPLGAGAGSAIVAARRGARWEPFFARYDPRCLTDAEARASDPRARSLQAFLGANGAVPLPLTPREATSLDDWDTEDDRARHPL